MSWAVFHNSWSPGFRSTPSTLVQGSVRIALITYTTTSQAFKGLHTLSLKVGAIPNNFHVLGPPATISVKMLVA